MPIKFRCPKCRQFLGISRSKAGSLSDCPTCGRTIRVPDLDGTVAPLPAPKLNLEDSELRQALGALAGLEEGQDPETEQQEIEDFQVGSAHFKSSAHQGDEISAVVVEPVEQPVPVVEAEPEVEEQQESVFPLVELADSEYAIPIVESKLSTRYKIIRFVLLILLAVMIFIVGFVIGRQTSPRVASLESAIENRDAIGDEEDPAPKVNPVEVAVLKIVSVSGVVTYHTKSGEIRADKGARVLLLPLSPPGSSRLPEEGFRVGALPIDQKILQAAVAASGGKFALADEEGKFELKGLLAGQYGMLIASRYQSKDDLQELDANISQLLTDYFQNPGRVLGKVQAFYKEVELLDGRPVKVDHLFKQE